MPRSSDSRRLTALRLAALGVTAPPSTDIATTVERMLAMQGQDWYASLWAVGLRTPGTTAADVTAAHSRAEVVRSWPFRGTLHVVRPDDLAWLLELTGERGRRSAAGRHRQLELDAADFDRAAAIARERLSGTRASRADLLAALVEGGLDIAAQRGIHLLGDTAQRGLTVVTGRDEWALLEDVITDPPGYDEATALRELARRYVLSHGPATDRDLAWWSSLPVTKVRAGLEAARDELETIEVDGTTYWMRPGLEPDGDGVHLLPSFDEYLLGYTDRSAPLAGRDPNLVVPGGNGMFLPILVVRGEVVGVWRRTTTPKKVTVAFGPFEPQSATTMRAFERAARRYADFLGLPLELT